MKLFELLTSFSPEELRGAKKAVQSPLFNSNSRVEILFDLLRKKHPNIPDTEDFKRKLYKKVFPTEKYNDYKLRRTFTELRAVLEDYLLYTKTQKDDYRRDLALTKIYGERNLYDFYKKKTEQLVQKIEAYPYPDNDLMLDKMVLIRDFYNHIGTEKYKNIDYLKERIDTLHKYFIGEQIIVQLEYKVLAKTLSVSPEMPFAKIIEPFKQEILTEENLNLWLYDKFANLIDTEDENEFTEIYELFNDNIEKFTKADKKTIFILLTNFAVVKMNRGNKKFEYFLFDLYKQGLKESLLFDENDFLHDTLFKNIVITGLHCNEFEWVDNFITAYQAKLKVENRETTKAISLSALYFYKKNFQEAINLLLQTKFNNVDDVFHVKGLTLRCYFELYMNDSSYFTTLDSYLKSFKKFIQRSTASKVKKEKHYIFGKFLGKLISYLNSKKPSPDALEKWDYYLKANEEIAFKLWFQEKIEQLKLREAK